ncbi:MAG: DUF84 family protein [bacterium]|nr:DUF84 family protein [bacterium]
MQIAVGSTSVHKIGAVAKASALLGFETEDILSCPAQSEQNEQPRGLDKIRTQKEIYLGARFRALAAKKQFPQAAAAVGIESGIVELSDEPAITIDLAVSVVLTADGREIVSTSPGITFPEDCVREAERRGFETHTVGEVIAERFGGDKTDPHMALTKGRISRQHTLIEGLRIALAQV